MVFIWTASSFCYFLINYEVKYIRGNYFENQLFSAGSEALAYFGSGCLIRPLGLKATLIVSFTVSIIGMLMLIYIETNNSLFIAGMVLGSKFGVASTFNMAF
jgi:hypothetical protein